MLKDFFKLNGTYEIWDKQEKLVGHFKTSTSLENVLFEPEWPKSMTKMKDYTFKNISLSKKQLDSLTFTECSFEDCLFIGCTFTRVEFHRVRLRSLA